MSRVTELEKALTTLFRKGTEVGYTETEIDEFLENIDYHALLQAVWNKAETVYAYRADGKNALSLDYRSTELFKQRATLLYEDVGDSYIGAVFAAHSMELWLLEDMGFDFGGLYEIYHRASCWCCPFQRIDELRKLRKHHPELWEKLLELDRRALAQFGTGPLGQFKQNWSVERLDTRFAKEDGQTG